MTQPTARPIPLIEVLNYDFMGACRYTGYVNKTIKLKLMCGHEQYRKASAGVPQKARCRECARVQSEKR